MMVWCAALYCKSDSRFVKNLRFYTFPADQERRRKWEVVCRRENWHASKYAKLCEKHFDDDQYEKNRKDGWKKLKPNAVPSISDLPLPPERRLLTKRRLRRFKQETVDPEEETDDNLKVDHRYKKSGFSSMELRNSNNQEVRGKYLELNQPDMQVHFEESQFEQNRQDGKKKLKPNAIPTIYRNGGGSTRRVAKRIRYLWSDLQDQNSDTQESENENCSSVKRSRLSSEFEALDSLPGLTFEAVKAEPSDIHDALQETVDMYSKLHQAKDLGYRRHSKVIRCQKERLEMANRVESLKSPGKTDRRLLLGINRARTPSFNMEKQMHDNEENLLKEWDTTVKCRREDSLSIRPLSHVSEEAARSATTKNIYGESKKTPPVADQPSPGVVHFDFPEIDIVKRHDTSLDDSAEIVEDDSKRFTYFDCPDTGQRVMRMELNVEGFEPKDITVKSIDGRLTIHGISHEYLDGTQRTNEFCRKIKLPDEVSSENLRCTFADHVLVLEAPVKTQRHGHGTHQVTANKHPLNCPIILCDENGKYLSLVVEIGRIFKPCDVVVKVRGQQMISITAEATENTSCSRMKAKLEREFDLPEKIDRKSLKAGCTEDRLLKIVARVKETDEVSVRTVIIDSGSDVS